MENICNTQINNMDASNGVNKQMGGVHKNMYNKCVYSKRGGGIS